MEARAKAHLVRELALADFKLRHYGSFAGLLWTGIKPLLMLGAFYIVFSFLVPIDTPNFAAHLIIGIVIWNYFADATRDGMRSIATQYHLLTKTTVDPETVVVSSVCSTTISFLIHISVAGIFLMLTGTPVGIHLLFLLYIIPALALFVLASTHILSLLYMRFTDIDHIWSVALQLLFWAVPIIYSVSMVPQKYQAIYLANPLTQFIVQTRNLLLEHTVASLGSALYVIGVSAGCAMISTILIRRYGPKWVDVL